MNPIRSFPSRRRLKQAALIFGFIVVFFWLPLEDVTERSAILVAACLSTLAFASLLSRYSLPPSKRVIIFAVSGAFAGLAITPIALFLMALKTGLHGHTTPDFSPPQMLAVIHNTPVWAGAGFLIGLGAGLWPRNR